MNDEPGTGLVAVMPPSFSSSMFEVRSQIVDRKFRRCIVTLFEPLPERFVQDDRARDGDVETPYHSEHRDLNDSVSFRAASSETPRCSFPNTNATFRVRSRS